MAAISSGQSGAAGPSSAAASASDGSTSTDAGNYKARSGLLEEALALVTGNSEPVKERLRFVKMYLTHPSAPGAYTAAEYDKLRDELYKMD